MPYINNDDKLKEECGVFAVYNINNAAYDCFLGLHALQHRGQEAAGIVSYDSKDKEFHTHLGQGEVSEVFVNMSFQDTLPGENAIGHVRYSTSGNKNDCNVQPVVGKVGELNVAIAHNGNLIEIDHIREKLIKNGAKFTTTMDTEIILHMLIQNQATNIIEKIKEVFLEIKGAFSVVMMVDDMVIGIRDSHGIRPLVLGKIKNGNSNADSYFLSSETCALDVVGAEYLRDIGCGEMIIIKNNNFTIFNILPKKEHRFCLFEYIYFLRPDSVNDNNSVYNLRKKMGATLAIESPAEADIVIAVPDSGIPAAIGYSEKIGIKYECGLIRNHYIGRTFIQPGDSSRNTSLHLKHNVNRFIVKGKRVIVVDDSIVRGNTSLKIVKMLRDAGATEIHMRIASPEIKFSCFYGIDTPNTHELISSHSNLEKIRQHLGLDSLAFLSLDGLYGSIINEKRNDQLPQFCDACFTGEYFVK